jgi:(R,R)-butanediol dehydrogenase/meso-butanediol dehydrogenase/diacetyl reductase/L-iditol 2-dehydrogenase
VKALFVTRIGNPETKELGRVELRDAPMPPVGDEEVLVKVAYASICGSDGHMLRGNLEALIQREYSLDEYEKAFADQLSGNFAKIVFKCN